MLIRMKLLEITYNATMLRQNLDTQKKKKKHILLTYCKILHDTRRITYGQIYMRAYLKNKSHKGMDLGYLKDQLQKNITLCN